MVGSYWGWGVGGDLVGNMSKGVDNIFIYIGYMCESPQEKRGVLCITVVLTN